MWKHSKLELFIINSDYDLLIINVGKKINFFIWKMIYEPFICGCRILIIWTRNMLIIKPKVC
jgi:hypothetical protein